MPSLSDMIFGTSKPEISSGMTSSQQRQFSALMDMLKGLQGQYSQAHGGGVDFLQQMFNPQSYEALEKPAMRQFNEQIVPGIAERFASMGSGSKGSSAMRNQLGRAGVDLETNLAQMRQQGMMQALPQALGLQQFPMQAQMGMLSQGIGSNIGGLPQQGMLPGLMQGFGQGIGQYASGGMGNMFNQLMSMFGGGS